MCKVPSHCKNWQRLLPKPLWMLWYSTMAFHSAINKQLKHVINCMMNKFVSVTIIRNFKTINHILCNNDTYNNTHAFLLCNILISLSAIFWITNWNDIATSCSSCSCWGDRLQKSSRLRRFKWDWDEIWQDCSSRKYTTIEGVRFSSWCHTWNMVAMTSFHVDKCCHLTSANTVIVSAAYAAH